MRLLGIDYGTKRIGVALSDETWRFAMPLTVLETTGDRETVHVIVGLVVKHGVSRIIVGDPSAVRGIGDNPVSARIDEFCEKLSRATAIPILRFEEAFTSAEARRYKEGDAPHNASRIRRSDKRPEPIDAQAAALILQRYIDSVMSAHAGRT